MTIKQFKTRFKEIKGKSYRSNRGDGAAGHKLESLLGITENNIASPDLGKVELKVHRNSSKSPITLFTFDKGAWIMPTAKVIWEFGHYDGDVKRLNTRVNFVKNNLGLLLEIDDDCLEVVHERNIGIRNLIRTWDLDDIKERFDEKLPAVMLVKADTIKSSAGERIVFDKAYLFTKPSKKHIIQQLKSGNVWIELRMKLRSNGSVRSHGIGFRTTEFGLKTLFKKVELIN